MVVVSLRVLVLVPGVSSSDKSDRVVSSKKRARRVDMGPALGVPIKREEDERLPDEAGGSSSQQRGARPKGAVLPRRTSPLRPVPG